MNKEDRKKIEDYIDINKKITNEFLWRIDKEVVYIIIRMPFYVKYSKTIFTKSTKGLKLYDKEGIERYSTKEERVARKFKYGCVFYLTGNKNEDKITFENKIKSIKNSIFKDLEKSKRTEYISGFCNECKDCMGHEIGTKTYYIDGFCDVKFPPMCSSIVIKRE